MHPHVHVYVYVCADMYTCLTGVYVCVYIYIYTYWILNLEKIHYSRIVDVKRTALADGNMARSAIGEEAATHATASNCVGGVTDMLISQEPLKRASGSTQNPKL